MRISYILCALLFLTLLAACGGYEGNVSYGPGGRNTPYPAPPTNPVPPPPQPSPEPQVGAHLRIGNVERNFFAQNMSACVVDRVRGEAVVTFADDSSGASLSIRVTGSEVTSLLVALGGEARRNNFKFDRTSNSNCKINSQISETTLKGEFQCTGLVNRSGDTAPASGGFLCRIQTGSDWNW